MLDSCHVFQAMKISLQFHSLLHLNFLVKVDLNQQWSKKRFHQTIMVKFLFFLVFFLELLCVPLQLGVDSTFFLFVFVVLLWHILCCLSRPYEPDTYFPVILSLIDVIGAERTPKNRNGKSNCKRKIIASQLQVDQRYYLMCN